ncbi:uncharacterized protein [Chironomus tepperi]|uniref:uncharacterized protein n=1 Tax=Chironomus tepperi TaxID=113505 RepID=UPI00391F6B3F
MDLLSALPDEIQTEVFRCLDLQGLLTATQVCRLWNHIIGKSKLCMEKITLICTPININFEFNSIMHSNRDYRRIKIYFKPNYQKEKDSTIRAVLRKFSKSITFVETTNDLLRICDLPKLKELRIVDHLYKTRRYSYLLCAHGLVANLTSITKLSVQSIYMDDKSSRILDKALKQMNNLKSLSVNHINFLKHFKAGNYKFKLEDFTYFEYRYPVPPMGPLFEFLLSNKSSLKNIRCDPSTFDDASFFLSNFPNLKTLYFHGLTVMSTNHDTDLIMNFPVNRSIKRLFVGLYYFKNHTKDNFISMLPSLKNLQELKICVLFPELIPAIFACPTLKLVRYHYLSDKLSETERNMIESNTTINFVKAQYLARYLH